MNTHLKNLLSVPKETATHKVFSTIPHKNIHYYYTTIFVKLIAVYKWVENMMWFDSLNEFDILCQPYSI